MLLTVYGRPLLVYQVPFLRDVYRRSGALLKRGSENRQKFSKIGLTVLFTDYKTNSNKSMLATHSHPLPIQPSKAASLLPSLLGRTCSQTHWVTPPIIDRGNCYKPGNTEFLQVLSGILRALWKVAMPFDREKCFLTTSDLYIENS